MTTLVWLGLLLFVAVSAFVSCSRVQDTVGRTMRAGGFIVGALAGSGLFLFSNLLGGALLLLTGVVGFALPATAIIPGGEGHTSGSGGDVFQLAGIERGDLILSPAIHNEFSQLGDAIARLSNAGSGTVSAHSLATMRPKFEQLRREHAKLLIRSAQLEAMTRPAARNDLERRRRDTETAAAKAGDPTAAEKFRQTLALIDRQMADLTQAAQLAEQLAAKRRLIVETVRTAVSTFTTGTATQAATATTGTDGSSGIDRKLEEVTGDLADIEAAARRVLANNPTLDV